MEFLDYDLGFVLLNLQKGKSEKPNLYKGVHFMKE